MCATKVGREKLRQKGIYPVLRELDKATSSTSPSALTNGNADTQEDESEFRNTLHALIGVLIRYEEEMHLPEETFSLRHLEEKEI